MRIIVLLGCLLAAPFSSPGCAERDEKILIPEQPAPMPASGPEHTDASLAAPR